MRATLQSTTKIVRLKVKGNEDGVPARIWEGTTESGIPFHAFIVRVAVRREADNSQFEQELKDMAAPSTDVQAYPLRMVL